VPIDWNTYVERVEQYFIANEIEEEEQVAVMLSLMGNKTFGLLTVCLSKTVRPVL